MGCRAVGDCDVLQDDRHIERHLGFYRKYEIDKNVKIWKFLMLKMKNMLIILLIFVDIFAPKKGKKHEFFFKNGLTACSL